jgi:hypothetical protein
LVCPYILPYSGGVYPTLFVFALTPCGPVGYYRGLLEAGAVPKMSVGFRSSQEEDEEVVAGPTPGEVVVENEEVAPVLVPPPTHCTIMIEDRTRWAAEDLDGVRRVILGVRGNVEDRDPVPEYPKAPEYIDPPSYD